MAQPPCWAEISLPRLKENFNIVRRHVGPEHKILAVVKADAYGHGDVPVAEAALSGGATWLAVALVS